MAAPSRVYLAPGMFGFARLASFDYFEHVVRALEERFAAERRAVEIHVVEVHPTSSIRRRAAKLARMVLATSAGDQGPIHIIGHSTGGLDARCVASPSADVGEPDLRPIPWVGRLRSITSMNTPHFGTPLASFFATVSGQRLLYAVSALTVAGLKLGAPPLAAASALVAGMSRLLLDHAPRGSVKVGRVQLDIFELELVDRVVDAVVTVLDEAASRELRAWLKLLRDDQGGIVQLMPEAMDLFQAGIEDRPGVRYQCVASFVPHRRPTDWLAAVRSPWSAVSATLFTAIRRITERHDARYPCAAPDGAGQLRVRAFLAAHASVSSALEVVGDAEPELDASDGIVPFYSQIWGEPVWVGKADHLDIVGHFPGSGGHNDWLASGAGFSRVRFDLVMDRVVEGMLRAEDAAAAPPT